MAAHQDFVHAEDEPEGMLLALTLEFGKSELVMGQQQRTISGQFDANGVCLRVVRPTFW
jgi:hypothetical protein